MGKVLDFKRKASKESQIPYSYQYFMKVFITFIVITTVIALLFV